MNRPTNFQTINGADGHPMFVVVPYDEFVSRYEHADDIVPDAVINLVLGFEMTPAKAWRTHLGLTQEEVAQRMGTSQSAYSQLEASKNLRKGSRARIAAGLGISVTQLNF
ncbi:MAG: helix-turn-helix transcriptional regulator [Xanthomonadaceae bacterium]|nr:helix-turn-helix transcriptional regulator [Xanthomonadaceae bacterium]